MCLSIGGAPPPHVKVRGGPQVNIQGPPPRSRSGGGPQVKVRRGVHPGQGLGVPQVKVQRGPPRSRSGAPAQSRSRSGGPPSRSKTAGARAVRLLRSRRRTILLICLSVSDIIVADTRDGNENFNFQCPKLVKNSFLFKNY